MITLTYQTKYSSKAEEAKLEDVVSLVNFSSGGGAIEDLRDSLEGITQTVSLLIETLYKEKLLSENGLKEIIRGKVVGIKDDLEVIKIEIK